MAETSGEPDVEPSTAECETRLADVVPFPKVMPSEGHAERRPGDVPTPAFA